MSIPTHPFRIYYSKTKDNYKLCFSLEFKEFLDSLLKYTFQTYVFNLMPYLLKFKKNTITESELKTTTESISNDKVSTEILIFAYQAVSRHIHQDKLHLKKGASKQNKANIHFSISRGRTYLNTYLDEYYKLPIDVTYELQNKSIVHKLKKELQHLRDKADQMKMVIKVNQIDKLSNLCENQNILPVIYNLTRVHRLCSSLDINKNMLKYRNLMIKDIVANIISKIKIDDTNSYIVNKLQDVFKIIDESYDENKKEDVVKHFSFSHIMKLQDALSYGKYLSGDKYKHDRRCFKYLQLYVFGKPKLSEYSATFMTACAEYITKKIINLTGDKAIADDINIRNIIYMKHLMLDETPHWKSFIQSIYQNTNLKIVDK